MEAATTTAPNNIVASNLRLVWRGGSSIPRPSGQGLEWSVGRAVVVEEIRPVTGGPGQTQGRAARGSDASVLDCRLSKRHNPPPVGLTLGICFQRPVRRTAYGISVREGITGPYLNRDRSFSQARVL